MLEKNFNAPEAEKQIIQEWQEKNIFACNPNSNKPAFSVVIPPPNVTGILHMGHALNNSIQDTLVRYKRMKGFDVLWQPGTDHAGIATQIVVEKQLSQQGISRHDLGREKFIKKVWEWKAQSGGQIVNQQHQLGASCDWARERFTMDEGLSDAVKKVFVQLYKEGLIYRDKRLVNWDPKLQTAVSDIEVIQKETNGKMWYMKYPVENSKEFITVATTRPETFFGDTAVAVNAEDSRYQHLIGKNVLLPIINKAIPIISDEHADPQKGTGAVKITPAHDFNDFEVGKRHNLPLVNILTNDAKLNENVPQQYQGLKPLVARPLVLEEIKNLGLYVKEEDNLMVIPYGERTNEIIEPWLTDQWFVDAKVLAKDAIEAIKTDKAKFVPKNWENTYFEWMNNIQPWCISRQLWWGHQVPVWYGPDGKIFCEESLEQAQTDANKHYGKTVALTRDTDVLDTWFSSGLWAFSTLGWPEQTPELKRYYPTSVLITAFDIIFFWVARMMMMSIHIQKEIPFKDIFIHGLVRDEKGQKMSKSKGNGIDPLEVSAKYGTDALRFSLVSQAGQGRDILMGEARVEGYRNFVTKIWNSVRFCEMNECKLDANFNPQSAVLPINKWILTKLSKTANDISKSLDEYAFNEACNNLYHFIWGGFCDWYLEAIKPIFYANDEAKILETRNVAAFVVDEMLKLIQPFMPFVAEELWKNTGSREQMIAQTNWPELNNLEDEKALNDINWTIDLITSIRSTRSEVNITPSLKILLKIKDVTSSQQQIIKDNEVMIKFLARIEELEFVQDNENGAITQIFDGLSLMIPLKGVIDVEKETARIQKEMSIHQANIDKLSAQLSNEAFVAKAPEKVVIENRKNLEESRLALVKNQEVLKRIQG